MAPSKWDDEHDSTPPSSPPAVAVAARRKFDDEEDSDDVVEDWDAAEDSEVEREKAAKAAAAKAKADAEAAANKKSKSQRIEEKRQEAMRRKALEDEEESSEEEDYAERAARLRQSEQDADLKHAQDLLDNAGLGAKTRKAVSKATIVEDKSNPGQTTDLSTLPLFNPTTKDQFAQLASTLGPLLAAQTKKAHYSLWVQEFAKQITKDLPSAEIKKVASGLTTLSNERMKEEKAADKGTKKTKAQSTKKSLVAGRDVAGHGRGAADVKDYGEDDGLGEDDFM